MKEQTTQLDSLIESVSKKSNSKDKLNIFVALRFNRELDEIFESSRLTLNMSRVIEGKKQLDKATFIRLCAYIGATFVTVTLNSMADRRKRAETETNNEE